MVMSIKNRQPDCWSCMTRGLPSHLCRVFHFKKSKWMLQRKFYCGTYQSRCEVAGSGPRGLGISPSGPAAGSRSFSPDCGYREKQRWADSFWGLREQEGFSSSPPPSLTPQTAGLWTACPCLWSSPESACSPGRLGRSPQQQPASWWPPSWGRAARALAHSFLLCREEQSEVWILLTPRTTSPITECSWKSFLWLTAVRSGDVQQTNHHYRKLKSKMIFLHRLVLRLF